MNSAALSQYGKLAQKALTKLHRKNSNYTSRDLVDKLEKMVAAEEQFITSTGKKGMPLYSTRGGVHALNIEPPVGATPGAGAAKTPPTPLDGANPDVYCFAFANGNCKHNPCRYPHTVRHDGPGSAAGQPRVGATKSSITGKGGKGKGGKGSAGKWGKGKGGK